MKSEEKKPQEIKDESGSVVGAVSRKRWLYQGSTSTEYYAVSYGRTGASSRWFGSFDQARAFILENCNR